MEQTSDTPVGGVPTKTFTIGEATKVELIGPGSVTIARGDIGVLEITAAASDLEHLEVKTGGESVRVEFHGGLIRNRGPEKPIQYALTIAALYELKLANGLAGDARDIDAQDLIIELKSGCTLALTGVRANQMDARLADGSRLAASGAIAHQKVRLSGGSGYDGSGVDSEEAEIDASDGSNVTVRVSRRLKAKASNGSIIAYSGDEIDLNVQTSGGSTFRQIAT